MDATSPASLIPRRSSSLAIAKSETTPLHPSASVHKKALYFHDKITRKSRQKDSTAETHCMFKKCSKERERDRKKKGDLDAPIRLTRGKDQALPDGPYPSPDIQYTTRLSA